VLDEQLDGGQVAAERGPVQARVAVLVGRVQEGLFLAGDGGVLGLGWRGEVREEEGDGFWVSESAALWVDYCQEVQGGC
jgi:hypothetical protein